jgi:hypothetical protein
MIENIMITIFIMIVISIILSIIGFLTKISFGLDVSILVNIITIVFGTIAIAIYVFTTTGEDVVETLKVVTFWFLYTILYVIVPMAVGEAVSRLFYNIAGRKYD